MQIPFSIVNFYNYNEKTQKSQTILGFYFNLIFATLTVAILC